MVEDLEVLYVVIYEIDDLELPLLGFVGVCCYWRRSRWAGMAAEGVENGAGPGVEVGWRLSRV